MTAEEQLRRMDEWAALIGRLNRQQFETIATRARSAAEFDKLIRDEVAEMRAHAQRANAERHRHRSGKTGTSAGSVQAKGWRRSKMPEAHSSWRDRAR